MQRREKNRRCFEKALPGVIGFIICMPTILGGRVNVGTRNGSALQSDQVLNFDAASVNPWKPDQQLPRIAEGLRFSPGRIYAPCADLRSLVHYAYHLTPAVPVMGLPVWGLAGCGHPNTFRVEATMPPEITEDQSRQMMQHLLEDRFKLKTHWEKREMSVFFLVVGSTGFKGKLYDPKTAVHVSLNCPEDDPGCHRYFGSAAISDLANGLSFFAGRPVINKTGISGRYTLDFMWASDSAETSPLPSLPTALREAFGLQLKPDKEVLDVLVIDHVEKPTPN
jgi:uncharacterized protein (TIGR03435 family)